MEFRPLSALSLQCANNRAVWSQTCVLHVLRAVFSAASIPNMGIVFHFWKISAR